jgi:hypothetical protein
MSERFVGDGRLRLSGRSGAPVVGGMSTRLSSMSGRILSTVHRPDNPQEVACQASP